MKRIVIFIAIFISIFRVAKSQSSFFTKFPSNSKPSIIFHGFEISNNYMGLSFYGDTPIVAPLFSKSGIFLKKEILLDSVKYPFPRYSNNNYINGARTISKKLFYCTFMEYVSYNMFTPCMAKIDTNGLQAVYHYNFANPTSFDFYDYSPDSYIYAQGETNRDTLNLQYLSSDCVVMKIDTAGNEVWRYTINSSSYANRPGGIVATPDSGCLVVYYYGPWPAYSVARALKLDKNGGLQWVKNIPLNTNGIYDIKTMDYRSDSKSLFLKVLPYYAPNENSQSYLYKLDSNMNVLWRMENAIKDSIRGWSGHDSIYQYQASAGVNGYIRAYHGGHIGYGADVRDSLGRYRPDAINVSGAYLRKIRENGTLEWEATYNNLPQGTRRVYGGYGFSGINTTSDGGYILTGSCRDTLGNQVGFLMKIDSLGCLTADSCETRFISSIRYYDQPATSLSIYPNPASDRLNINLQGFGNLEGLEISFYNLLGQKTHQQKITQTETNLSVSQWQRGIYFYELSNSKGRVASGKICIE